MPYIGKSPSVGLRTRYNYTATAGQTSFTGADNNNVTLTYTDTNYTDVYLNGTLLLAVTDYASTTGTSIVLTSGASLNDVLEVVVYDVFSVADTVSAVDGGTFKGNVNFSTDVDVDGTTNLDVVDIDGAVDMASTLGVTGVLTTTAATVFNGGFASAKASNVIAADGAAANAFAMQIHNLEASANQSFGLYIRAGSGTDQALEIVDHDAATNLFRLTGTGVATIKNGLTLTDGNLTVAAGHGIDFAAQTQSSSTTTSELLDHYEEGTFTPGITHGSTVADVDVAAGSYTKVGRLVTVNCNLRVQTVNGTGTVIITGLPFTVGDTVASTSIEANGSVGFYANMGADVNSLSITATSGTTTCSMQGNFTTSGLNANSISLTNTQLNATAEFRCSISYFA